MVQQMLGAAVHLEVGNQAKEQEVGQWRMMHDRENR
jgi:hypothetical protein